MLGGDYLAQGGSGRLHRHFGRAYFNLLCDRTVYKGKIYFALLIHLQPNVCLFDSLKTLGIHSNRVIPDGQQRRKVMPGVIRLRFARKPRALRGDGHRRPRNYRSRFVGNGAQKTPIRLTVKERANEKCNRTENCHDQRSLGQHRYPPRALSFVIRSFPDSNAAYAWPRPSNGRFFVLP